MEGLSYEQIRERNMASNRKILLSLNLSGPGFTPTIPKPTQTSNKPQAGQNKPQAGQNKRRASQAPISQNVDEQPASDLPGRRRSGRIQAIKIKDDADYDHQAQGEEEDSDEEDEPAPSSSKKRKQNPSVPRTSGTYTNTKRRRQSEPQRKARSLSGTRPNPKVFGHQIGVEVGDWWDMRMSCSQAGVHAPPVSGIAGNEADGCWSVALSGGYEDDVDLGYAFTFTGAGGRALSGTAKNPKNLRTAPQTFDQEFTGLNAALRTSVTTKNPVRVIRGFKNHSPFAPDEGYRYDGLYQVQRCWRELGQAGFQVCKYAFVRLPGQPKIPVKEGREAEAEEMYRDMGFVINELPPSPEKRRVWTKTMAKQRIAEVPPSPEEKPEEEKAENEHKEEEHKEEEHKEEEHKDEEHKEEEHKEEENKEEENKEEENKEEEENKGADASSVPEQESAKEALANSTLLQCANPVGSTEEVAATTQEVQISEDLAREELEPSKEVCGPVETTMEVVVELPTKELPVAECDLSEPAPDEDVNMKTESDEEMKKTERLGSLIEEALVTPALDSGNEFELNPTENEEEPETPTLIVAQAMSEDQANEKAKSNNVLLPNPVEDQTPSLPIISS